MKRNDERGRSKSEVGEIRRRKVREIRGSEEIKGMGNYGRESRGN